MLQSMPPNPALILGVCWREGQTIPSPGSQKAAWPHLAPSVWLERQRSANQSQFSCDTCVSKAGSATSPALCPGQHWGTQSMFPPPSLPPTLMTPLPDVSQQDISLMIFFSFPQNTPRLNSPNSSPTFGTIQKVQSLRCCRLCSSTGTWRKMSFRAPGTKFSSPHNKIIQQNSLLLQQPPGFEVELFFQSHMITNSTVPTYKACWACTGPNLLFGLYLPKGSLRMSSANPAFGIEFSTTISE